MTYTPPLPYLRLTGGTLTGSLVLSADPTVPLGAVTKQYADVIATAVAAINSAIGATNGIASLDSSGKLTNSQIPSVLLGALNYQGNWNASTGIIVGGGALPAPATANKGWYYMTTTAGTYLTIFYQVGDWIVSDGTHWSKVENTDAVVSVFGRTGIITLQVGDITAPMVPNLDWSKITTGKPTTLAGYGITDAAPIASPALTGVPTAPTASTADASTQIATTALVQNKLNAQATSLSQGLVSFWPFDETPGTTHRDVVGSSAFTGSYSPTVVAGLTRLYATYVTPTTSVMSVSSAESAKFYLATTPASFSVSCKVKFASFNTLASGSFSYILNAGGSAGQWRIKVSSTGVPTFSFTNGSSVDYGPSLSALTAGVWYQIDCYYDASRSVLGISINNGTATEVSFVGTTIQPTGLLLYSSSNTGYNNNFTIQDLAIWNRVLTSAEKSLLYNYGAGLTFPFNGGSGPVGPAGTTVSPAFTGTPTAPTPATGDNSTLLATTAFVQNTVNPSLFNSLISYWPFDEAAGVTKRDAFGSTTLTGYTGAGFGTTASIPYQYPGYKRQFGTQIPITSVLHMASTTTEGAKFVQTAFPGRSFTVAGWYYVAGNYTGANYILMGIVSQSSGYFSNILVMNSSGKPYFNWYTASANASATIAQWAATSPAINTWHFVVAYYDSGRRVIGITVDNNTPLEVSVSASWFPADPILHIGTNPGSTYTSATGFSEWGWWSRVLTTAEQTALWNSGQGKTIPFVW